MVQCSILPNEWWHMPRITTHYLSVRSSHHEGHLAGTQLAAAPVEATVKMRTAAHFDTGQLP